jgi:proteasome lid subunit RPN8/RPN11
MLQLPSNLLLRIHAHVQKLYPAEGAGFLLGTETDEGRQVEEVYPAEVDADSEVYPDRFFIDAKTVSDVEDMAEAQSLTLLGIFHSHPDHPAEPSVFDREWALPWYSYLITVVRGGVAGESCSWRLSKEGTFAKESLFIRDSNGNEEEQWPPCISPHP